MSKPTKQTKLKDITHDWHLIDVKGKILGRVATEVAQKLMGKSKAYFVPNLDCGDHVVLINADKVEVSGKKEDKKKYTNYSGYPGGLRTRTYAEVKEQNVKEIIIHAVRGMLPKNKLRAEMLKRLHVYNNDEHEYAEKFTKN